MRRYMRSIDDGTHRERRHREVERPGRLHVVGVVQEREDHLERDAVLSGERGDVDRVCVSADPGADGRLLALMLDRQVSQASVEVTEAEQGGLQRLCLQDDVEGTVGEDGD